MTKRKDEDSLLELFVQQGMDDKVKDNWDQWFGLVERKPEALLELLQENVASVYKAMALGVLLCPYTSVLPFSWLKGKFQYLIMRHVIPWSYLDQDMQEFAARIVILFHTNARRQYNHVILGAYNHVILQLLTELPCENSMAEKLFELYELGDSPASSHFSNLLLSPYLDIKWKKKADFKMRSVVSEQLSGKRPNFNVLKTYAKMIEKMVEKGGADVYDLILEQANFFLDKALIDSRIFGLLDNSTLAFVMSMSLDSGQNNIGWLAVIYAMDDPNSTLGEQQVEADLMLQFVLRDSKEALVITGRLIHGSEKRALAQIQANENRQMRDLILARMRE
jgi:hypothetical protein